MTNTTTTAEGELAIWVDPEAAGRALRRLNGCLVVFLAGAAICVASYSIAIWAFYGLRKALDLYGWGNIPDSELAAETVVFDIAERFGTVFDTAPVIAFYVSFVVAMSQARRVAEAAGVRDFQYGWGWTVGTMFIPLVNLVRPWLGFAEIRRAILQTARTGMPSAAGEFSHLTLLLGITFFVGSVIVGLLGREIEGMAEPVTANDFVASIGRIQNILAVMLGFQSSIIAVMLVYLATIRGKAKLLVARANRGAEIEGAY